MSMYRGLVTRVCSRQGELFVCKYAIYYSPAVDFTLQSQHTFSLPKTVNISFGLNFNIFVNNRKSLEKYQKHDQQLCKNNETKDESEDKINKSLLLS